MNRIRLIDAEHMKQPSFNGWFFLCSYLWRALICILSGADIAGILMAHLNKIFLGKFIVFILTIGVGYVLVERTGIFDKISHPSLATSIAYATSTQTQLSICHEPTIMEILQDPNYPVDNVYVNKILKLAFWYPSGMYSEQPTISKPGDTAASLKFSNASHELLTMLIQEFPIENYPKVLPEEWGTSTEFIPPGALKYDRDRIGDDGAEVIFWKDGYRFDVGEAHLSHEVFKRILNSITVSQVDKVILGGNKDGRSRQSRREISPGRD